MKDAVIVSTARTPIGPAFKGALNNIKSPTMTAHAIKHAVDRAGIDDSEVEDVIIGSVLTAGTAGNNVARLGSIAAGIPVTAAAQTVYRQCSSGLMAISMAAKQIIVDGFQSVLPVDKTIYLLCKCPMVSGRQKRLMVLLSRCNSIPICQCFRRQNLLPINTV
jgi:hypothetical protein